jgi:hypothetical protein
LQNHGMALKRKALWNGEEIPGLVKVAEIPLEKGTLDVPEFKKIRVIQNGISKNPPIEMIYKIERSTNTKQFFKDFYFNDEVHDLTLINTDAHGAEIDRILCSDCECVKYSEPETDLASPPYAQITIIIIPWEITPLDAE